MSTTYTLIIQNNHGQNGNYAIFNNPPAISTNGSSPDVYSNVWVSGFIPDGGNTTVNTNATFYAWAGTTQSAPAPGVTMQTGTSRVAQLTMGTNFGSAFAMSIFSGVPTLAPPTPTAQQQGAYEIDTDNSFQTPNSKYMVGLGKEDPTTGLIGPVASILADNNSAISVQPIMKFYVATSSYKGGQIVNFTTETLNSGVIDFSTGKGAGKSTAIVTHNATGKFNTIYLGQEQTVRALAAVRDKSLPRFLNPQTSKDKKVQLNQVIETLEAIVSSLDDDTVSKSETALGNPLQWIGKVKWPATVLFSVATAGSAFISNALITKGYSKWTEYTWHITPPGSGGDSDALAPALGGVNVVADWNTSVAADTQQDDHVDEGIMTEGFSNATFELSREKQSSSGASNRRNVLNGGSENANGIVGNNFSNMPLKTIAA